MENYKKPDEFREIPEVTPSRNPAIEKLISDVYLENNANDFKNEILEILSGNNFSEKGLEEKIKDFNDKMLENKGYPENTQSGGLDTLRGKNGTVEVIYYPGNKLIRFKYTFSRRP